MTDRVRNDQEKAGSRSQQAHDAVEPEVGGRSAPSAAREEALVASRTSSGAGLTDRERKEPWPLG